MAKITRNKTKVFLIYLIFIIAIFCKYFQFGYLSSKYFIDSNKILLMIRDINITRSLSYEVTASFFRNINFFKFDSLFDWSIYLTVIFNIIFFILLICYKEYTISELIFIYASMALLDIFSFNLSKEIIQILIFNLIYFIILLKCISNKKKVLLINIILILESIFFRNYYILFLISFNITYYYFSTTKIKSIQKMTPLKKLILSIITFLIILGTSVFIVPSLYYSLLEIRYISEYNLAGANTVIKNVFQNDSSYYYYILNYIVNFIRILMPIELLKKGIYYFPFVIYQLSVTYYIISSIKEYKTKNIITVAVVLAYFMTSVTFEPDFGSVVRHESTIFMLLLLLKKESYNKRKV